MSEQPEMVVCDHADGQVCPSDCPHLHRHEVYHGQRFKCSKGACGVPKTSVRCIPVPERAINAPNASVAVPAASEISDTSQINDALRRVIGILDDLERQLRTPVANPWRLGRGKAGRLTR